MATLESEERARESQDVALRTFESWILTSSTFVVMSRLALPLPWPCGLATSCHIKKDRVQWSSGPRDQHQG